MLSHLIVIVKGPVSQIFYIFFTDKTGFVFLLRLFNSDTFFGQIGQVEDQEKSWGISGHYDLSNHIPEDYLQVRETTWKQFKSLNCAIFFLLFWITFKLQ